MQKIVTFDPRYLPAFTALNRQWIEMHFVLEPMDLQQLEQPHESILKPGGEIFFLLDDDQAVATVAMIPHGPGCYELAKMAVALTERGKGYGDILIRTCLDWARAKGASKVMLLSNTVLTPAITLYKKHGFRTVHLGDHPDYQRCNIEMEIDLGSA
jgi:GNAT superfamily N-acetyltransferase